MSCHHLHGLARRQCSSRRCGLHFLYCPDCMLSPDFCPDCAPEGVARAAREAARRARGSEYIRERIALSPVAARSAARRYYAIHREHILELRRMRSRTHARA